MGKKATFDAFMKRFKRPRDSVRLPTRSDLILEMEDLEEKLVAVRRRDADSNEPDEAPEIERRIGELAEQVRDSEVEIVFESMSRGAYANLMSEHPPTDAQIAKWEEGRAALPDPSMISPKPPFNEDTFSAAVCAASCVGPDFLAGNEDAWRQIYDEFSPGQWARVWLVCNSVNSKVADLPKWALAYANQAPPSSEPS